MKLYHVETSVYGSFGSVVIAETEDRAIELFLEKHPHAKALKYVRASLLATDLTVEYVQPEMIE